MPQQTPAGWYPAPHANNEQRFWDGERWTDAAPPTASTTTLQAPGLPGQQPAPQNGQGPRNFAVAAIVFGGAAFLTGLIPVLGLLLALTAVVLSIVALVKGQPKAMAVTALVLGSIALLTGLFSTIGALAAPATSTVGVAESARATPEAQAPAETEEPVEAVQQAPAEVTEPAPATTPSPAPAPAAAGTIENPAPQPYVAKGFFGGDKYSLTGRVVDANANALVESYNMFNSEAPAGFKYVVVELTMTGVDPDGVEPSLASYDLSLATPEGNRYDGEYIVFGDGMSSMSDGPTLYPGSTFTGYTAYVVPEAAQSFLLYDNGKYVAL